MIKIDLVNFLIIGAFVTIWRYLMNALAALFSNSPFGQAVSIIAA